MQATRKFTLLKNTTTTDAFGDEVDSYRAVREVFGHVGEKSRTFYDPQSGRADTVRVHLGLLPYGTEVAKGYRLLDQATDTYYYVEHVLGSVAQGPVRVELKTVE